jgi:hypothetical protein
MKTQSLLKGSLSLLATMLLFAVTPAKVLAQSIKELNLVASSSKAILPNTNIAEMPTVAVLDTVSCMFNQVASNQRVFNWRKGYIVLENKQIMLGNVGYPVINASQLTGLIQNRFLSSNKKTIVKKQIIQVVVLQ